MMKEPLVYEYRSYKEFVRDLVKGRPHGGRGMFRQMAEYLKVHSTLISQVFRGTKDLSAEQAFLAAEFLNLDMNQTDYFLALVEYERASFEPLRERIVHRLDQMRLQNQLVKNRIKSTHVLPEEVKARFYSHWHYAAIRLATDIPALQDVASIAAHFGLSRAYVEELLEFLSLHGLVVLDPHKNKYKLGPARTHIDQYSPYTPTHHRNWRLKALDRHIAMKDSELAFSAPMTLSVADLKHIKELILTMIQEVDRTVRESPSETLACLNIDLLRI